MYLEMMRAEFLEENFFGTTEIKSSAGVNFPSTFALMIVMSTHFKLSIKGMDISNTTRYNS